MGKNKRSKVVGLTTHNVAKNLITSVFFVWAFTLLLNNAPFSWTTNILVPIRIFMIVAIVATLGGTITSIKPFSFTTQMGKLLLFIAYICAALSFLLLILRGTSVFPELPFSIFLSLCLGAAFVLFVLSRFILFMRMSVLDAVTTILWTFCPAIIIFILLGSVLQKNVLLFVVVFLLLVCSAFIFRDYLLERNSANAPELHTRSPRLRLSNAARASQTVICALLFICGMVLAFEFNVTQKSLHFVGSAIAVSHLGGTSLKAILYLILSVVLLAIVKKQATKTNIPLVGSVAAILLSSTFFMLPYLTSANFFLVTACVTVLLCITILLFFKLLQALDTIERATQLFSIGLILFTFGGFIGGGLSYVILARLTNWSYFDEVFRFAPAIFMLVILIILLLSYRQILELAQKSAFNEKLDSSTLEARCRIVATRYKLTSREHEVLALLSQGRNVPGVAATLNIAQSTAKTHALRIYRKIGVSSHQELLSAIYADE